MKLINVAAIGAAMLSVLSQACAAVTPQSMSSLQKEEGEAASVRDLPSLPKPAAKAVPATNPGGWIVSDDYPAEALAFQAKGATGFRLFIDEKGVVDDCIITRTSGFEILDKATCKLIQERASFTAARDAKGKPARDTFASRVVWGSPDRPVPLVDRVIRFKFSIDRLGHIASCDHAEADDYGVGGVTQEGCPTNIPPMIAQRMREYGDEEVRDVTMTIAHLFDELTVDKLYAAKAGETVPAVGVWRFDVSEAGTVTDCVMQRQKGDAAILMQACGTVYSKRFVPDVVPAGQTSKRHGWVVVHYARKTGP